MTGHRFYARMTHGYVVVNRLTELNYTLFHEMFSLGFFNIIGLPERRNKRKSVLEITKMYYF